MSTKKTAIKPNKREAKVADKAKAKQVKETKSVSKGKQPLHASISQYVWPMGA